MPYTEENELEYCYTEYPVCPHCDHQDIEWWDGEPYKEAEEIEIQCGSCLKKFRGYMETKTEFFTRPLEELED